MITPYIGGQTSMGGQPSTRGKPLVVGKSFTGGKTTWFQHQKYWEKASPTSPSIPNTTSLYLGKPFPGVSNPLWGQPNPSSIPSQGTFHYQSINPMIMT